jgi:isoleucyl-tRNA synthetase
MAPVLSFTAEEIWQHMPKRKDSPESVFLSQMPVWDERFLDEQSVANWDQVLRLRDEVLKVLEESRKPGIFEPIIGHSLDAEISFYPDECDSSFKAMLTSHNQQAWEDIFIVSKVKVEQGPIPYKSDWDCTKEIRKTTGQAGSFGPFYDSAGKEGRMYDSPLLNGPIVVFKAQGFKCERCWKYVVVQIRSREDVGRDPGHPNVCARCSQVLTGVAI